MRSHIVIKGGRDGTDQIAPCEKDKLTRGVDIGLYVRDKDGKSTLIPGVLSLVLRVHGRKAVATVEIEVDDVDVTAVWLEEIRRK